MTYFLELFVAGVAAGGTYALFAVGLTMVYGTYRFINFAHGELISWGAYGALLFLLPPFALALWAAIPLSLVLTTGIALGTERFAFRPLEKHHPVTVLIASIGASFVLRSVLHLVFGADLRSYELDLDGVAQLAGLRITYVQIAMMACAIVFFAGLYFLLRYTLLGKSMRAVSDNPELAGIFGLPLAQVRRAVWVLGASFAAVGGILLGLDSNLDPFMGLSNLIKAFAAVLLGGAGNVFGAMFGGLAIGIVENLGTAVISPGYKDLIAFAIIIVMLLFRPQGLFALRGGVR